MSFLFNGQRREWSAGLSVQQLLLQEGYGQAAAASGSVTAPEAVRLGVAVAINEQVLPRSSWVSRQIARDERVELFQAIAGG